MTKEIQKEIVFKGIAASGGVSIGPAIVISKAKTIIEERNISAGETETEIQKFSAAIEKTKSDILELQNKLKNAIGEKDSKIFDAHMLILSDKALIDEIEKQVRADKKNIDFVFNQTIKRYVSAISSMPDSYFRERAADIKDIAERVLRNFAEGDKGSEIFENFTGQKIIVADELAPTDIAELDREKILAIVTETGAKTSHTAIMSRSLGIPAVVGIEGNPVETIRDDDIVVVDGYIGTLILHPSQNTLHIYAEKETRNEKFQSELLTETRLRPETIDGFRIQLAANIEYPDECESALKYGAAGIGLMRTEYLVFSSEYPAIPSEGEQFEIYSKIASDMKGQPVVIRTFDIGGDKLTEYFKTTPEPNPFLGWRATRIFLEHKEIMKSQIRAILRAGAFGNVKIMFPMITVFEEVEAIEKLMQDAKEELKRENLPFDEKIQKGIMIETPSAALIAEHLAKKVDFFSIGTNDLTQYTLAVDRTNKKVAGLYQPGHPSILKLINNVVTAAKQNGVWVSVCGEMAGDPAYAILLIGLGVNELSMTPSAIGPIRRLIRRIKLREIEELSRKALSFKKSDDSIQLAKDLIGKVAPEIFSVET
jgi:phosphotransferase system enzyme I (PtsI)